MEVRNKHAAKQRGTSVIRTLHLSVTGKRRLNSRAACCNSALLLSM
jgi:hypothetical protein